MGDRSPGFQQLTALAVGPGVRRRVRLELERLGSTRPALLIDANVLATAVGNAVPEDVEYRAVITAQAGEPSVETVAHVAAKLKNAGADGLVATGGGSTLDTGKLARGLLAAGLSDPRALPEPLGSEVMPLIAVPTTAGTGAEVGAGAIVHDARVDSKILIRRPELAADVALADAELTLDLPSFLTAVTGLDAFAQALMAYVSAGPSSISGSTAIDSLRLIWKALPQAVADPLRLDARSSMMLGSVMSALAMYNAPPTYAGEHVFAEQLGPVLGVAHGHAVAAFLPGVVEFNCPALTDRFAEVSRALSLSPDGSSDERAASSLASKLRGFVKSLEVPPLPQQSNGDLAELVRRVERHEAFALNPRRFDPSDAVSILIGAFDGSFSIGAVRGG